MSIITSSYDVRLDYEIAKQVMAEQGYTAEQANPAQGYIRSEVLLNNTTNQYHIPVLVNDNQNGPAYKTEWRLALQNVFIMTRLQILIGVAANDADGTMKYYTYENPAEFTTSGASAALRTFWNGRISLTMNNNQLMPAWNLTRHYKVPETQQLTAPAYYASTGPNFLDSQDLSSDGIYPVQPTIIFNGAGDIEWSLKLPAAIATLQASVQTRAIFIPLGILLQNVTTVK